MFRGKPIEPSRVEMIRKELLWPGVPLALGAAALFGASAPFAKLLLAAINPWMLAGVLYLGAGLGLLFVRVARGTIVRGKAEAPLSSADLPWLIGVIVSGGILGPLLLMFGLARIDASSASLLLNLEAVATMALAWIIFRENVDRKLLLGALVIVAGAGLVSWNGQFTGISSGAVLVALACLSWGIDNNLTRKLSAADPLQIAMIKGLSAGSVNVTLALAQGARLPPMAMALEAGLVGLVGYGVSLALFIAALRHLGAARTSAYFSTAPFIGAILSIVVLNEPLTVLLLLAGVLMSIGVWLHLSERHQHEHVHEVLEHEHRHVHDEHHQHKHGPFDPLGEPHVHRHRHVRMVHSHPHYPDLHHRHQHR